MIRVKNLSKRYQSRPVVDDVSLTVSSGKVVGLLGPNGAGKTTCFHMIVGLIPAGEGSIDIDGIDITTLPMHARTRHGLGYLPQEASVFRKLTVEENILSVLELQHKLNSSERKEKTEADFFLAGRRLPCLTNPLPVLTRFLCWIYNRSSNTCVIVISAC